jgi:hypothetical protein
VQEVLSPESDYRVSVLLPIRPSVGCECHRHRSVTAVHALPDIRIHDLGNNAPQVGMLFHCHKPLCRCPIGLAVHGNLAVTPGLLTDPRQRIVPVLGVVEKPIGHAVVTFRRTMAPRRLTDIHIAFSDKAVGVSRTGRTIAACQYHRVPPGRGWSPYDRLQFHTVPHGNHDLLHDRVSWPLMPGSIHGDRSCAKGYSRYEKASCDTASHPKASTSMS